VSDHGPKFHGDDLDAAKARAKALNGLVVRSLAPGHCLDGERGEPTDNARWGYWSDDDGFVRSWEEVIARYYD